MPLHMLVLEKDQGTIGFGTTQYGDAHRHPIAGPNASLIEI